MGEPDFGEWQKMASAPRDGSKVLVALKASEQGPAEVDVARWARSPQSGEACWIAADSDPTCPVAYADSDLAYWMKLPTTLPKLRLARPADKGSSPKDDYEMDGSSI